MAMKMSRRLRRRLTLIGCALGVAVLVLLLPARLTAPARVIFTQVIGPAEEVAFHAGGDAVAAGGTLRDAFLAEERGRALEQQEVRLRNEQARLENMATLLALRLRSSEGLQMRDFPCGLLSAVVTSYDATAMNRSVIVAAGSADGVERGLAVCSAGAVVGTITEVGPWRSRVTLVTDASSALPCRISRTRDLCILRGTGGTDCRVEWVDRTAPVERDDVLVTAPVDEVASRRTLIPPGLPIATVVRVDKHQKDPFFLRVTAAPRVKLQRLEVVEIVIPTPPAAESEER
jgi:rod shape-determining protein MreC